VGNAFLEELFLFLPTTVMSDYGFPLFMDGYGYGWMDDLFERVTHGFSAELNFPLLHIGCCIIVFWF
jgi:hypothetical protein